MKIYSETIIKAFSIKMSNNLAFIQKYTVKHRHSGQTYSYTTSDDNFFDVLA